MHAVLYIYKRIKYFINHLLSKLLFSSTLEVVISEYLPKKIVTEKDFQLVSNYIPICI